MSVAYLHIQKGQSGEKKQTYFNAKLIKCCISKAMFKENRNAFLYIFEMVILG